jgi:hypothetical protein
MANTRIGNPNVFASLPFDQIDGVAGTYIHDDFLQAVTVTDYVDASAGVLQPSDSVWVGAEIAGNACVANGLVIPGEVDHPGILQLQSGTSTPAAGDGVGLQLGSSLVTVQDTLVLDTNGVYVAAILRQGDVLTGDWSLGFEGQTPEPFNASALDVVAIGSEPTDFTGDVIMGQVNGAGTDVEVATLVAPVDSDWFLAEVGATSTSAAYRITTEDVTQTVVAPSPTMPVVALRPVISTSVSTGTAEVTLDVDAFHFRYLRRSEITANGADWLGA